MAQPTMSMYHLSFNQDYTCFSVGLNNGFRIFNTDPFKPTYTELHSIGGIGLVAMLFRCNQFCLVAGGPDPKFSRNKVMIWEVLQNSSRCIGELALRSVVKNVKFRRDKLIIVFLQKVQVYNISDLRLLHQIETALNTNGLCEISNALSSPIVLACLGLQKGQVRVENIGLKTSKFISAHDSNIACISITQDGRFLATASTKGTLIRVFNTSDGSLLQEVRRGSDKAEIYSLAFSSNAQYFAVSSDKGTVHVFGLKVDPPATSSEPYHQSNGLAIFNGFLPKYLSSERSVAQFRLPQGSKHFVGFGHQKNTIVIIGMDGSFYRCEFDPVAGGEMSRLEHLNFLNPEETFT